MSISQEEWMEAFESEPIEHLHIVHAAFLLYDRSMTPDRGWKVGFSCREDNGEAGPSVTLQDRVLSEALGLPLIDMGDRFEETSKEYYMAYMLGVMRQPEARDWFLPRLEILERAYEGAVGVYVGRSVVQP